MQNETIIYGILHALSKRKDMERNQSPSHKPVAASGRRKGPITRIGKERAGL